MKVIHLSDLHVGKSKNTKRLGRLVKSINKAYKKDKKDIVILSTGDMVDDGNKRWQHKEAGGLFEKLRKNFKVLTVPGNHDYGWNGIFAREKNMKHYKKYLKGELDFPTVDVVGDVVFVGLDSMEDEHNIGDQIGAEGELGKQQLHELDVELEMLKKEHKEKKIVVYLHHHPFFYNRLLRLKDADDLKEVVKGRVDALLFGHEHHGKRFRDKETKYDIDLIVASDKSTSLEVGANDQAVFRLFEIDMAAGDAKTVDLNY